MDEKGKRIQAQIQFMERNVKALEELVTKMVRIREAQEAFYVQFSKGMQDIGAQEDFSPLSQCFGVMADSCKKLNTETHEIMIQRPEEGIMQMLTQIQDWGITPMKRLLEDREKACKFEVNLQKEYDEKNLSKMVMYMQRMGPLKEKEKRLRMLSDQKRRVENVNILIDLHMKKFEYFRLVNLKKVFKEIARSHAFYYAKGLECFSSPCSSIAKVSLSEIGCQE